MSIELRVLTQFEHMNDLLAAKESFEKDNPGVRIIVEQATDNFESLRAMKSDQPPDIMDSGGWGLFNLKDIFIDLMPFVQEVEGLEEDLNPGIMRIACKDGTLPGLPIDISVPLIMYNKAMFDREGLPYPQEGWTWDELMDLAHRLTLRNEEGIATQFGFGIGPDIECYEPFILRNGGRFLSPEGSTARGYVDSEATVEAFRKVIELYRVHRATRKPEEPSAAGHLHEGFANIFAYTWFTGGLIEHGIVDQFGVVGLPRMPGGEEANMIYMGGCGITTKCEHPKVAWEFLRHYILERPERFRQSRTLPATRSLAEQSGMTEHPIWGRYIKELDHVQASGYYLNEKWNTSRQLINEDIQKLILDGSDVRHMLQSWTRYA